MQPYLRRHTFITSSIVGQIADLMLEPFRRLKKPDVNKAASLTPPDSYEEKLAMFGLLYSRAEAAGPAVTRDDGDPLEYLDVSQTSHKDSMSLNILINGEAYGITHYFATGAAAGHFKVKKIRTPTPQELQNGYHPSALVVSGEEVDKAAWKKLTEIFQTTNG